MGWIHRLAIPLVYFALLSTVSLGATSNGNNPWSNPDSSEAYMRSVAVCIARKPCFTQEQAADISEITESLTVSIDKMNKENKATSHKLQAMNMALGSSISEIAMSEGGGGTVQEKTEAIAECLEQGFFETSGEVNWTFIEEIKRIIQMFARVSENDVASSSSSASASSTAYNQQYGGQGASSGIILSFSSCLYNHTIG